MKVCVCWGGGGGGGGGGGVSELEPLRKWRYGTIYSNQLENYSKSENENKNQIYR